MATAGSGFGSYRHFPNPERQASGTIAVPVLARTCYHSKSQTTPFKIQYGLNLSYLSS